MNKSKTKKLALLTTVILVISVFSFIPAVQAKTTKRSIEDWLVPVPGINGHAMAYANEADLAIWPHNWPLWLAETFVPIWDCTYDGYVLEREVKGNKLAVTVSLHVTGVPFTLTRWIEFDPPPNEPPLGYQLPIFKGMMHYTLKVNFILDLDLYEIEFASFNDFYGFYPEGYEFESIPYLPLVFYAYGWVSSCEFGSIHFNGAGTGEFLESYDGWEVDDSAKVKVHEISMFDKDFKPDHPKDYGEFGFWPVEFIFFH